MTIHLTTLLDMVADAAGDRTGFGPVGAGMTYDSLAGRAAAIGERLGTGSATHVGLLDVNSEAVPLALFAAARVGLPFVPLNYRLDDELLREIASRVAPAVIVVGADQANRLDGLPGITLVERSAFLDDGTPSPEVAADPGDPSDVAVKLFTSGTTGAPKAALLRHRHLSSYLLGTIDFLCASEDEASLVSVPPYHVAGVSAVLSSMYAGRRVVYLTSFEPDHWVRQVADEGITHAMVVPTMLARILDSIEAHGETLPKLRSLSSGGGRMPLDVIERALTLLPHVGFVNAYGLTETSSTLTMLGPEDHREAFGSDDPEVRARLTSVGRPLPSIELEIRDADGAVVADGVGGEVWVRGEQVAGEYAGNDARADGWFPTRDEGTLRGGYLYLHGRLDDVIVRGGENISPGEVEDVLRSHPAIADVAVVGLADDEWGEAVAAVVVPSPGATPPTEDEVREHVRAHLRSSKVPSRVVVSDKLPYNEMGKLLRREIRWALSG